MVQLWCVFSQAEISIISQRMLRCFFVLPRSEAVGKKYRATSEAHFSLPSLTERRVLGRSGTGRSIRNDSHLTAIGGQTTPTAVGGLCTPRNKGGWNMGTPPQESQNEPKARLGCRADNGRSSGGLPGGDAAVCGAAGRREQLE